MEKFVTKRAGTTTDAEVIRRWRPWERSTGPRTASAEARSARDAYRGGLRPASRNTAAALRVMLGRQGAFLGQISAGL